MEELDDGVMGPFPGVSCQHVYATQSAAPKNSSVKHVLSDLEDNNCIDGRGQVTLSSRSLYQIRETSRSLCQIRETCATRFRSILCDVTITIELMDGDRSQHHPDNFIKLEKHVLPGLEDNHCIDGRGRSHHHQDHFV